ncbi:hypothetical protein GGI03_002242 [Coemansia sp. RSA 2337]|nr:hypothetical protein GGH13_001214 [Coemansia sp. S155-1]KAJ2116504.1 hypothetical protein IW146_001473 [Coemansia sp. RSA 922]KAJ2466202.1 hypothetical protein GGI03_002242 [Coemansia sp. RSA 2337]
MDNVQSLLGFVGVWVAINAVVRLVHAYRKGAEWRRVSVELVSPLHLRLTTTALNDTVMVWAHSLTGRVPLIAKAVDAFYSVGVVAAVASMLLCLALLAIAGAQIAMSIVARLGFGSTWSLLQWPMLAWTPVSDAWLTGAPGSQNTTASTATPLADTTRLQRRLLADSKPDAQWLRPVIPGVTMPLGHLWYYLLSLIICAVVHELGHALAAARANIRLRSFGLFVMGVYPGAFVDLPRDKLEQAPPTQQLRIVCAGVWHNAVTALLAWLLVHSGGLGWAFSHSGWMRADTGVVVVDVAQSSPLFGRIPLLSTVYRVDDVELRAPIGNVSYLSPEYMQSDGRFGSSPIARWSSVLTNTKTNTETATAGFCAQVADNVDDGLCCEISPQFPLGESPDANIFCFEQYRRPLSLVPPPMCFDLRSTLARASATRCQLDTDCANSSSNAGGRQTLFGRKGHDIAKSTGDNQGQHMCVLPSSPYPESRVLRLYYYPYGDEGKNGKVLVYVGSPKTLWLEMQVSSLRPRWHWLSCRLPSWTEAIFQYILSFSLAFCLLNAIPAWYLDGDHLLRLLLSMAQMRWSAASHLVDGESSSSDSEPELLDSPAASPVLNVAEPSQFTEQSENLSDGANTDQAALPELDGVWSQIYVVATTLTTGLLAWCVIGSLALLAL